MKLQLFILSVLLIGAIAHPVPDEEVSPLKAALPADTKSAIAQTPAEKPIGEVKSEIPAPAAAAPAAAAAAAAPAEKANIDKKLPEKVALPEIAPDAEIAQAIPEKKEEKASIEKQTRADDKVSGDVKALPVVEVPVAGVESQKQVVDVLKPVEQPAVQPVGKNADLSAADAPASAAAAAAPVPVADAPVSEQKKEELSAIESAPAVKSELPIAAPTTQAAEIPAAAVLAGVADEKKDEQPARQERGTEEQVKQVVAEDAVKPVAPADVPVEAVSPVAQPEVKSLNSAAAQPEAAKTEAAAQQPAAEASAAGAELKAIAAEKPAEATAAAPAAGDIPTQENALKALPAEAQKVEAAPAAAIAPEAKKIEEQAAAKPQEAQAPAPLAAAAPAAPAAPLENAEPLKKLDEKPAAALEEKKSDESSESKESKESKESNSASKESEESKENKSN